MAAIFAGYIALDVLACGKAITQPTTIGVRGELFDLVDLGKALRAYSIQEVPGDAAQDRETGFDPSQWLPARGRCKTGARPGRIRLSDERGRAAGALFSPAM